MSKKKVPGETQLGNTLIRKGLLLDHSGPCCCDVEDVMVPGQHLSLDALLVSHRPQHKAAHKQHTSHLGAKVDQLGKKTWTLSCPTPTAFQPACMAEFTWR